MARIKDLAKDTLIYGLAVVLNPILNTFVLLLLITTHLSTAQYGIYTTLYALSGILVVLYSMRMETTYFRMTNDNPESVVFSNALSTVVFMSSIFSIILIFFAPKISSFFGDSNIERYLYYFAVILWLDAFTAIPFARLRNSNQSLKFSLLKIANVLITLVFILLTLLVLPNAKLEFLGKYAYYFKGNYLLDGLIISNVLASFFIFLYFTPSIKRLRISQVDQKLVKKMLAYTLPLVLIGVAGNANQFLDRILIPFMTGESPAQGLSNNGIYGGATKIATIMLLFTKAFNYAYDPFVFKAYKENKNTDQLGRITGFYTAFSGVIFVGAIAFIPFLSLLLGTNFKTGMQYVPLLLLAYLVMGLYYHFSVWYKLKDKTMAGAWIAIIGVFITLISNSYLLPKIGLFGPALTILITYSLISIICIYWGRRHLVINYPFKRILLHVLASSCIVFVMIYWTSNMNIGWILNPIIFTIYLIGVYSMDESIRKMLKSFRT